MKDYIGQELSVGDFAIMIKPGVRELQICSIIEFTPKSIKVNCKRYGKQITMLQTAKQLVKIDSELALVHMLKNG